jgi:hypothetical protein
MRTLLTLLAAVAISLLGGGCSTPSLNPLATPETTATDQDLIGRWADVKSTDTTYVVTQAGDNEYHLQCIPKESGKRPLAFSFKIVRLAETRYLDLTVTKTAVDELGEKYGTCAVPAHAFMKMKRKGDELTIWLVKSQWLNDGLKSGEIKLAHATTRPRENDDKETYILTGPTSELQTFFRKNADVEEAFEDPVVMHRLSDDGKLDKVKDSSKK